MGCLGLGWKGGFSMSEDRYDDLSRLEPVDIYRKIKEQREASLDRVVEARNCLEQAKVEYEKSILAARAMNIPILQIAKKIGLSETAVRMYIKRSEERRRA